MRFGGHETFAIRHGWLSKGLLYVQQGGKGTFDAPDVVDTLGIGRNMGKSLWHWLQITDLATRSKSDAVMELTDLGNLIFERDPYLQHPATWWALHVNLVTWHKSSVAWQWFFNDFGRERFDRMMCIEEFIRFLQRGKERIPSRTTISRDIACLLQSYALPLPPEAEDPEDLVDCPFRSLGLLVHQRDTGYFERRYIYRSIPPELLGYVVIKMIEESSNKDNHDQIVEIPFSDVLIARSSPGRVFALNADGLTFWIDDAQRICGTQQIHSFNSGGERMIGVKRQPSSFWLKCYYDRVGA